MRKVTKESVQCFIAGGNGNFGNTTVSTDGIWSELRLHGNLIAVRKAEKLADSVCARPYWKVKCLQRGKPVRLELLMAQGYRFGRPAPTPGKVSGKYWVSWSGWSTSTTRERLNGLCGLLWGPRPFHLSHGMAAYNDKPLNPFAWYRIREDWVEKVGDPIDFPGCLT